MIAAPVQRPPLSQAIVTLLQALTRGAAQSDVVVLERHGGPSALGPERLDVAVRHVDGVWVPMPIVRLFEESALPWSCRLALQEGAFGPATSLSALAVTRRIDRETADPEGSESANLQQWRRQQKTVADAAQQAELVLPPTMVIDARDSVTYLWALREPIALAAVHGQSRARRALRALAAAVGAELPHEDVDVTALSIPLVGTRIANGSNLQEHVDAAAMDASRVYSINEIMAGLTGAAQEQ